MLAPAPDRSKRRVWITAAAAAFVVIAGAIAVLARVGDDHSTSTADPDLTTTFVSPRNGFSVEYPNSGQVTVTPATDLWDPGNEDDDGADVLETGSGAVFKGGSLSFPGGPISIDEYIDDYVPPGGCSVPRGQREEISIDGRSGTISECPNEIVATVATGGRIYQFTLLHDRSDARAVFDAFAATIDLTPKTAVDFPNLTTTFVSPTYGYSFGYIDRGGLAPATELWDPVNQQRFPVDSDNAYDRLDGVDTGFGAYFAGASTEIPDGVSIDEWVDDYVSPSGCGRPRSQQEEITIDGQSGRIFECPTDQIVATVVAGGRLYLFTLLHNRSDARAFFDAFIATIDLARTRAPSSTALSVTPPVAVPPGAESISTSI